MTDAASGGRLPASAHTSRPWRIHAIAPDFRLEDVWALPTPGDAGDFPRLVELFGSLDPERSDSRISRALFAIRWKVGELLGWDEDASASGVPTLRERLPDDLRDAPPGAEPEALPFRPLYRTGDEWAAEIVNRTVHSVLHLAWVREPSGAWRGQMAVLVKRNGLLGSAYMVAITPFRYVFVYPALLRELGRRWRAAGRRG